MPSSPKKNKRREADFYPTPEWCTRALFESSFPFLRFQNILEPCAGHGAISKVIKKYQPSCSLVQYELNKNKKLQQYGEVTFGDFLKISKYDETIDCVVTNPPFSLAQEFIETCRKNYPNADIAMLLPLSFLGSAKRNQFWKDYTPNTIKILSDRPSFTNDGKTDSSVYGWFIWLDEARKNIHLPMSFLSKPT